MVCHFYQMIAIKELDQSNVGYVSRHWPDHHLEPVGICLVSRFTFTFWCLHFQQAKSTCCLRAFGIPSSWCWKASYWPSPPSWCELLHVWGFWEFWRKRRKAKKTSRLNPTIQHLGLPCLLTALPWNGIIGFPYKRGLIIIAFEKWIFLYYLSVRNLQTVPDSGLGGKDLTAPQLFFWIKSTASLTLRDW